MSVQFVPDDRGGVTVVVDGHLQSHVDLAAPDLLVFEYIAHMAAVIDLLPPGPLAVTHVGGAGLTLARYVQHTRPRSPQIVLEPAAEVTEAVRRELPLPRGHRIRVRPVDGRSGVAALRDDSAAVVVLDAFDGGRLPAELVTAQFFGEVARVLRGNGVALVNIADEPGLRFVGRVVATLREVMGPVALIATHEILRGRRFGNVVLVAGLGGAGIAVDELRRIAARQSFPTGVWDDAEMARRFAGAAPLSEHDDLRTPVAPDPGRWRLR